jgi:glycosyltransferase involved in cell wall biosynthesis
VNPPVDTSVFQLQTEKEDYYVTAGRFVPFKRLDIVAEAFKSMPDKKLYILGDGPEMEKIKSKAGPNTVFPGFLPAAEVNRYLSKAKAFIFPSEEDFGIVPVEAQACGTPVIAFGKGGALETVIAPGSTSGAAPTGLFFHEQTAAAIVQAVRDFESQASLFVPQKIHDHAQAFAIPKFKEKLQIEIDDALKKFS